MELPQELIEVIIDAVVSDLDLTEEPWIIHKTPDVLETLRACALAAQAFLRPCQMYIFHGIAICDEARIPPPLFSTLLLQSPHLASYVRALYFEFSSEPRALVVDEHLEAISHILTSATNLERLDVSSKETGYYVFFEEPPGDAFLAAFSLPYLRHLTLWNLYFTDASALQAHLEVCTSLKTLVLRSLDFDGSDNAEPVERPTEPSDSVSPPRVVLDALHLYFLAPTQVQDLVDSFNTVVDITHLRSLYLHNTPMNTLLRVNAATIQRLTIRAYFTDELLDEAIDPDALADAHDLQALDLQLPFLPSLNRLLRRLGSLGHLMCLRTVSVTVSQKTQPAEWQALDELLDAAPALAEVNIYSGSRWGWDPDEPQPEWMPALAGRDVLRIHHFSSKT
ncbi:hypothetical protein B0H19DRAFT_1261644 [Mycena capillaripes]|nr:hypothetical protein B0H19DRAFT_1261644 [Mycena capillaripes]